MRITVVGVCLVGLALITLSLLAERRPRRSAEIAEDLGRWEGEGGASRPPPEPVEAGSDR